MKITYSTRFGRYVVSDRGTVTHMCQTMGDAMRLAGLEPEPLERFTGEDAEDASLEELFGDE